MDAELIEEIARYIADFNPPGMPVDWDAALYRVEKAFDIDLPDQMTDPLIKRIQKVVRAERRARA
jgi:hypothetical protein